MPLERLLPWIIRNCDEETYDDLGWESREEGIIFFDWTREGNPNWKASAAARAWAVHKDHEKGKEPKELKAGLRNALEKKKELERVKHMDTSERIYWRFKDLESVLHSIANPPNKGGQRTNPKKNLTWLDLAKSLMDSWSKYPYCSTTLIEIKTKEEKTAKSSAKDAKLSRKKIETKIQTRSSTKRDFTTLEIDDEQPYSEDHKGKRQLEDSLNSIQSVLRSDAWWEIRKRRNMLLNSTLTPKKNSNFSFRFLPTPPETSSDTLEIPGENMEIETSQQSLDHLSEPTPPQQVSDIIFDNNASGSMNMDRDEFDDRSITPKYAFRFMHGNIDNETNDQFQPENPYININSGLKFISPTSLNMQNLLHCKQALSNLSFDPNQYSDSMQNNPQHKSSDIFPFSFDESQYLNTPPTEAFNFSFHQYPDTISFPSISSDQQQYSVLTPPPDNLLDDKFNISMKETIQPHPESGNFTTDIKEYLEYLDFSDFYPDHANQS